MNNVIHQAITDGRLILFLGAGASTSSTNRLSEHPPLSAKLAELIAGTIGWQYNGEPLGTTYSAAKSISEEAVNTLLCQQYQHCTPSAEYLAISEYPWARIYTTNIDDALENALRLRSKQKITARNRNDRVHDKDQVFQRLDYVYLNGTVNRVDDGFIFSAEEYGQSSARPPLWYEEMASDFFQCNFLFIGSRLDEPIFYHQVERYRQRTGSGAPQSYVLTPEASEIQKASLQSYGLTHIAASLSDFVAWLKDTIPTPPSTDDIAIAKIPELRALLAKHSRKDQERYVELLKNVTLISPDLLRITKEKRRLVLSEISTGGLSQLGSISSTAYLLRFSSSSLSMSP